MDTDSAEIVYTPRLQEIIEDGIPWNDTEYELMHNSVASESKGWLKNVYWKKAYRNNECIGMGAFAGEDIFKGEILNKSVIGKNAILMITNKNLPKLTPNTIEYLKNFGHQWDADKYGKEHLIIIVPGIGTNHSDNPNLIRKFMDNYCLKIASEDIKKDEELCNDYQELGKAPDWFLKLLSKKRNDTSCVFKGCNDYVGK